MDDEKLKLFESYLNKGFSEDQLYEIKLGIEQGNDVSAFARLKMPASEMAHIRKTQNFKKSLNKIVEKPKTQVEEIIEEEIDIRTKYEKIADIAISIGETSIVIGVISLLLIMLRVI